MKTILKLAIYTMIFLPFASVFSTEIQTGSVDQKGLSQLVEKKDDILSIVSYKERAILWVGIVTVLFPIIIAILGWFGIKEFNIVKTLALRAKEATDEIENIKNIALLRLHIEDYNRLALREGEYTEQDHMNMRLRAQKLIIDYDRLSKNTTMIDFFELDTFYINALADAYYEVNDPKKAKELLDKSCSKDEHNPETHYKMSFVCEVLSNTAKNDHDKKFYLDVRMQHARKAVEYDAFNAIYVADLAFAEIQFGNLADAEKLLRRAMDVDIRKTQNFVAEFKGDYPDFFLTSSGKSILKELGI